MDSAGRPRRRRLDPADVMTRDVLVLNGPNLNLLGVRQPEHYGRETLADVDEVCRRAGAALGLRVECRQSNAEGELVSWIQQARGARGGLMINAGGYSHTSVAILDALLAFDGPVIEVHMSNILARESFRRRSYISLAASGTICGLGSAGYRLGLDALAGLLDKAET